MRTLPTAAAAAGAVLCAGTALAGMQRIDYRLVGTNLVDTGSFNWTVDVIAVLDADNRLDAVAGNGDQQKLITSSGGFYQNSFCGGTSLENNEGFWPLQPSMEFDSFVTIGSMSASGNALQNIGIDFTNFENGGDLQTSNGTWFVIPTEPQGDVISHDTHSCDTVAGVTIARLTILGEGSLVTFEALFQGRDEFDVTWQHTDSLNITYDAILDGDCNGNGIGDGCDLADGTLHDDNGNGIPDECEFTDCNGNGINDPDDIADGTSQDCDGNGIPDECDLADGAADCDGNGVLDSCELGEDCNGNGVIDSCDIADGTEEDCDGNGRPDSCDIADGGDQNGNGELDACEITPYLNLNSGLVSDTAADAIFAASNGDSILAMAEYINAETEVDFLGKALYMDVTDGDLAASGDITLGGGTVLDGGGSASLAGLNSAFSGTAAVEADASIAAGGLVFVRSGAGVELNAPIVTIDDDCMIMSGGSLTSTGDVSNTGSITTVGNAIVVMGSLQNENYISSSGTYVTDMHNAAGGELRCNDETMLSGNLNNDGLVTVNRGPLYIMGNLTNNGTILGDVDTGPGFAGGGGDPVAGDGLRVSGNYTAGAGAELIMPHANWRLSVGGDVDIAINNHDRFIMDEATLALTGESGDAQNLEAMSLDVGSSTIGIDRTFDGHFPLGVLVIEAGTEVMVVDNHDNAGGAETMYVKHLVIEAGSVFITGDRTVWYETVDNNGTVIGDIDVIAEPCPGDDDGNGEVNIDDLLAVIGNFTCTGVCDGDADGNGVVDINDLLMTIGNFGPCS
jgi:hypothetical protein